MNHDGDTRHKILLLLLQQGPISASAIAKEYGLTTAGIRRHLDNIVADGLAEIVDRPHTGQRGRPAKLFRLTHAGRAYFGHDYDSLALMALQMLKKTSGEVALEEFATERMRHIFQDARVKEYKDLLEEDDNGGESREDLVAHAHAIAQVLTEQGYAATVDYAAGGVQICRHHCPIQDVAQQFPELCAAEHRVVAELLGHHTQPLATIADGNGICTTHIPLTTIHPSPPKEI